MTNKANYYLVICGQCKHKLDKVGIRRLLPHHTTCPKCGFTAKVRTLFRSTHVPRHSRFMLAISVKSFAYAKYVERWNGEEEKQR